MFSPEYSILNDLGENKITLLAERYGKENIKLAAGDNVKLCEGVYAEVLGPLEYNGDDDNDNSLVLRVAVNGGVFLFTGDMQFTEEFSLIEAGAELAADVLKVGNHGNKDATSGTFADAVAPEIAVISTDRKINPPSRRIVSLFSKSDVYVTGDYKNWLRVTVAADGTISVD